MKRLKVLLVHNSYTQRGGEDTVFESEKQMLLEMGIEVYEFVVSNNDLRNENIVDKVRLGIGTIWSFKNNISIKKYIKKINPDIVHVHNTFPYLSPSIYWAIKSENKPVVQTLHNYRIGCANGILYRNNSICVKCIEGSNINSIIYNCYRESKVQTLPIFLMQRFHNLIGTYRNKVDKYLALTEFSKDLFLQIGLPYEKVQVKPNFTIKSNVNKKKHRKKQVVFVGRITEDKGIDILLKAFSHITDRYINLMIIGEGEDKDKYKEKYENDGRITWLGNQPKEVVFQSISESTVLVMASKMYETFGLVLTEAMSMGTPVIAPNHGSFPKIIKNGVHGLTYEKDNFCELEKKIIEIINLEQEKWDEMSANCIREYEQKYSQEQNKKYIADIYSGLISENE